MVAAPVKWSRNLVMRTIRHGTAAWVILAGLASGRTMAASDAEDGLKSAAGPGFLRDSEWPSAGTGGAITVGVVGRPSFAGVLRRSLDGKLAQNRPVRVVDFKDDPRCCQLLYFAPDRAAARLSALNRAGVAISASLLRLGQIRDRDKPRAVR